MRGGAGRQAVLGVEPGGSLLPYGASRIIPENYFETETSVGAF